MPEMITHEQMERAAHVLGERPRPFETDEEYFARALVKADEQPATAQGDVPAARFTLDVERLSADLDRLGFKRVEATAPVSNESHFWDWHARVTNGGKRPNEP